MAEGESTMALNIATVVVGVLIAFPAIVIGAKEIRRILVRGPKQGVLTGVLDRKLRHS